MMAPFLFCCLPAAGPSLVHPGASSAARHGCTDVAFLPSPAATICAEHSQLLPGPLPGPLSSPGSLPGGHGSSSAVIHPPSVRHFFGASHATGSRSNASVGEKLPLVVFWPGRRPWSPASPCLFCGCCRQPSCPPPSVPTDAASAALPSPVFDGTAAKNGALFFVPSTWSYKGRTILVYQTSICVG